MFKVKWYYLRYALPDVKVLTSLQSKIGGVEMMVGVVVDWNRWWDLAETESLNSVKTGEPNNWRALG